MANRFNLSTLCALALLLAIPARAVPRKEAPSTPIARSAEEARILQHTYEMFVGAFIQRQVAHDTFEQIQQSAKGQKEDLCTLSAKITASHEDDPPLKRGDQVDLANFLKIAVANSQMPVCMETIIIYGLNSPEQIEEMRDEFCHGDQLTAYFLRLHSDLNVLRTPARANPKTRAPFDRAEQTILDNEDKTAILYSLACPPPHQEEPAAAFDGKATKGLPDSSPANAPTGASSPASAPEAH